jgi:Na+/H+ antiporter NhaC
MQPSWFVLLPPLLVLLATFVTRKLNISLILGLLSAAFIATDFSVAKSARLLTKKMIAQITDIENLYLYAFLLMLGVIITIINHTGGALAFAQHLMKKLKSSTSAQVATMSLSTILFIDDYLSYLTTGHVMRPINDKFNIPRAKLAFLIHSLGGPIVILGLVSSWVALITSQLDQAGVNPLHQETTKIVADPFFIYIKSLPFIFYSFLMIGSTWFIVLRRISFGPMRKHELIANQTGNLNAGKQPIKSTKVNTNQVGSIYQLLIPISTLIITFLAGTAYSGGYYLFGGTHGLLDSFKYNTQPFFVLFISGLITLVVSCIIAFNSGCLSKKTYMSLFQEGIDLMHSPVVMVFLASTLGILLRNDLKTGTYLAQLAFNAIPLKLLPALFFSLAFLISFITGTSWGTIALMVPLATQMLTSLFALQTPVTPEIIPILFPVLGALFSGATAGDHLSPISETTIMAASSAGCYPIDHTYTQFFYALPALCTTLLAFVLSGYLLHYSLALNFCISLGSAMICCLIILLACNRSKIR